MKLRFGSLSAGILAAALVCGCGGSMSGVQAVAPGPQSQLMQSASGEGEYSLYRASGFDEAGKPTRIERMWTVSVSQGQPLGFRWAADKAHQWDPDSGMHLVAVGGSQSRDLGVVNNRTTRYAWAGANGNVGMYFEGQAQQNLMAKVTMQ